MIWNFNEIQYNRMMWITYIIPNFNYAFVYELNQLWISRNAQNFQNNMNATIYKKYSTLTIFPGHQNSNLFNTMYIQVS